MMPGLRRPHFGDAMLEVMRRRDRAEPDSRAVSRLSRRLWAIVEAHRRWERRA